MQSNKFWADGSSSESEQDSDSDSDNEVVNNKVSGTSKMYTYESDSESEDEVREVKSHKDKAWGDMVATIKKIKMAMKIDDWSSILDEFKALNKTVEKSKMLILKNGIPPFYIRILHEIETLVVETLRDKPKVKNFKSLVAKSFNTMKLTVKKHNKQYEKELEDLKANPSKYPAADESSDESDDSSDSSDDSSDESDDSSSSDDESSDEDESSSEDDDKKFSKPALDSDDDDSLFGSDSDSSSDSDSDDSDVDDGRPKLAGRAKWLKKTVVSSKKVKKDKKPREGQAKPKQATEKKVQPVRVVEEIMTEEALDKKTNELISMRGRKGTDHKSIVYQLEVLAKVSRFFGPRKEIPVLMHLVSAMFDGLRSIDEYMDLQAWRTCRNCMMRIVTLLDENKNIILGLVSTDDVTDYVMAGQKQTDFIKKKEDGDEDEEEKQVKSNPNLLKLVGTLENYLVRLEDEYTKSLQQINPHTQDYVIRLSDEAYLLELAEGMQKYFLRINDTVAASEVALLRVEHLYYKHNSMALQVAQAHNFTTKWGNYNNLHPACTGHISGNEGVDTTAVHPASFQGNPSVPVPTFDPDRDLEELYSFIFKHGDDRRRTRALLCAVYHHAMHDRYHQARDLFLISHIQDNIEKTDTKTQILYNRTLVTLGLSAFRAGLIQKAYDCLYGVCSGRPRELLAQGQTRYEKDPEQEKAERRRQMPYHMHINPDLLDCCFLTCAMLIELPQLVGNQNRKHSQYRKYLQAYNRQLFNGPPESTREHILAASKALVAGDWKKASSFILNLDVWSLIPNEGGAGVKNMLSSKLKDEALRIYLFKCSGNYEAVSLSHLCALFEIDRSIARRIISKMIFRNELSAAWDQCLSEEILLFNKVDASSLQQLALQVSEKIAFVMECNERILDPLTSTYNYKDDWSGRDSRKQHEPGQKRFNKGPHWKPQNANSSRHPHYGGNKRSVGGGRGGARSRVQRTGVRIDDPRKHGVKPAGWGNAM